ncbi:hypothetical protein J3U91_01611 [Oenococcus oeni]|nr:hypothetical protein J3U91_01611 [Oenococcus oeni]
MPNIINALSETCRSRQCEWFPFILFRELSIRHHLGIKTGCRNVDRKVNVFLKIICICIVQTMPHKNNYPDSFESFGTAQNPSLYPFQCWLTLKLSFQVPDTNAGRNCPGPLEIQFAQTRNLSSGINRFYDPLNPIVFIT